MWKSRFDSSDIIRASLALWENLLPFILFQGHSHTTGADQPSTRRQRGNPGFQSPYLDAR